MSHARRALAGLTGVLVGAAMVLGCEPDPQTAIMVEVDSDIPVSAMNRVRLSVASVSATGTRTQRLDTEYPLAERAPGEPGGAVPGQEQVRLPLRLAVLPRADRDGAIHVAAAGLRPGESDASVFASSLLTFVPGRTLLLRVLLYEVCVDVVCDEGETCAEVEGEGLCIAEEIDRPECALQDLESGRVEGCAPECSTAGDCDDQSACTTDACSDGRCSHEPACDSASPLCCDGVCAACCDAGDCDDEIDCTDDACDAGACTHTSICSCSTDDECGGGKCCDGACFECCERADCDDEDPCTVDACEADACTRSPLCEGTQVCCDGTCNPQCCTEAECEPSGDCWSITCVQGECNKRAFDDGTPCPDGVCLSAEKECVECLVADDCPAVECHGAPACNAEHACHSAALPDRTPCTGDGLCCHGRCTECCTDEDCAVVDPCEAPTCDPEGRCVPACLDDGVPCGDVGGHCLGCVCQ